MYISLCGLRVGSWSSVLDMRKELMLVVDARNLIQVVVLSARLGHFHGLLSGAGKPSFECLKSLRSLQYRSEIFSR
jgi:hypothetical protein